MTMKKMKMILKNRFLFLLKFLMVIKMDCQQWRKKIKIKKIMRRMFILQEKFKLDNQQKINSKWSNLYSIYLLHIEDSREERELQAFKI